MPQVNPQRLFWSRLIERWEDQRLSWRWYNDGALQKLLLGQLAIWGQNADNPPNLQALQMQHAVNTIFWESMWSSKIILARTDQLGDFERAPLPSIPLKFPEQGAVFFEFNQPLTPPNGGQIRGALILDIYRAKSILQTARDLPKELILTLERHALTGTQKHHSLLVFLVGDMMQPGNLIVGHLQARAGYPLSHLDRLMLGDTQVDPGVKVLVPQQEALRDWYVHTLRGLVSYLYLIEAGNVVLKPGLTPEEKDATRKLNKQRSKQKKKPLFRDYWNVVFVDHKTGKPYEEDDGGEDELHFPADASGHRKTMSRHDVSPHWRTYRKFPNGQPRPEPHVVWIPKHERGFGEKKRTAYALSGHYDHIPEGEA